MRLQRGFTLLEVLLSAALIVVLAVAAYSSHHLNRQLVAPASSPSPTVSAVAVATAPAPSAQPAATSSTVSTNVVDVTTIKVGDRVGNMTVTSVGPFRADYGPTSSTNAKVTFTGEQE